MINMTRVFVCFVVFFLTIPGCALKLDRGNIVYCHFGDKIVVNNEYKLTATDFVRATYVKPDQDLHTVDDFLFIFYGEVGTGQNLSRRSRNDIIVKCDNFLYNSNPNGISNAGYTFSDRYVCVKFMQETTRKTWSEIYFATQIKNIDLNEDILSQMQRRLYNGAVTVLRQ